MTPPQHLPHVVQAMAPWIERYGYLAVALGVCLEDFGLPLPGETLLVAGAVYAGLGRLSIWWVVALAVAGAILGDNIGWLIGRSAGRRAVVRFGRYVGITHARLDRVEGFFRRHGAQVVAVARFVEVLRQLNGIAAGIAGMPWRRFLAYNALGAVLWVGVWAAVGYFAGSQLDVLHRWLRAAGVWIALGVAVALVAGVIVQTVRRRRRPAGQAA
ncbi:MAG TPA: DedA family protein [Polyangia bacterium]|jgi:membrane protein DedA with SNARE-associated domain